MLDVQFSIVEFFLTIYLFVINLKVKRTVIKLKYVNSTKFPFYYSENNHNSNPIMQYRPGKETITVMMKITLPHATGTAATAATTPMTGGTTSAQLANAWTLTNRYTSFSLLQQKITIKPCLVN